MKSKLIVNPVSGTDTAPDYLQTMNERVWRLRAREPELQLDRTIKVKADGEVLETDRCLYRILPRATRFLAGHAAFASPQS